MKDPHRYDDIIELEHHRSHTHPPLSMEQRAAQFSPFAALTGYGDCVSETARLTEKRILLDENEKSRLDEKLQILLEHLEETPQIRLLYFRPDTKKEGGSYETLRGILRRLDPVARVLLLRTQDLPAEDTRIPIDDIYEIECELFSHTETRPI